MASRHKAEWALFRESVMRPALDSQDPERVKLAKLMADLLKAYQEGERKTEEVSAEPGEKVISIGWRQ